MKAELPAPRQIDILCNEGFSIRAVRKGDLFFPNNLTGFSDVDKWLRKLLPDAFLEIDFLVLDVQDILHSWTLVKPFHGTLHLDTDEPGSVELLRVTGGSGKGWIDRSLYFSEL